MSERSEVCPLGNTFWPVPLSPSAAYSCCLCSTRLHHTSSSCPCARERRQSGMGFYCEPCSDALDLLEADTVLGKVHEKLLAKARRTHWHGDD